MNELRRKIRPAQRSDVPELLQLIADLAEYERAPHEAVATARQLEVALFGEEPAAGIIVPDDAFGGRANTPTGRPAVYCLVAEADPSDERRLAGMALWFLNFSTWRGVHGIYLEDLFVRAEYRGRGIGKSLLAELARIAVEHGYQRLEWWVLDWNEPALRFYRSIGAEPMSEWTVQRVSGEDLAKLAEG